VKVFAFLCADCSTLHEEWVDNAARYGDAGETCPMCDGGTEVIDEAVDYTEEQLAEIIEKVLK
jgi:hypothetical protein